MARNSNPIIGIIYFFIFTLFSLHDMTFHHSLYTKFWSDNTATRKTRYVMYVRVLVFPAAF